MGNVETFIAAVDAFLLSDKRLIGADMLPRWAEGRDRGERRIKLPIEVNGELRGQSLVISAYPNHPTRRFHLSVVFEPAVCRVDFHEDVTHANPLMLPDDGLPRFVKGPHYHPWRRNRRFVRSDVHVARLRVAEPLGALAKVSFDSVFRWFCADNKIQLPDKLEIELPGREELW